ncbi:MAG: two-component system response regulator [Candidatus Poribacteria bacterium]|nr:MAG: two-component system response regulator [Candidatus Poribacteria bacterium]
MKGEGAMTTPEANKPRILVVEDEEAMALLIQDVLEEEGYQVELVYDGDEAIRFVQENPPDLVVLDINMPGRDGVETLNRIVELRGSIPVILHTAYSAYKDNFMTWSAAEYVVKSSDFENLKQAIRQHLGRSQQSQVDHHG